MHCTHHNHALVLDQHIEITAAQHRLIASGVHWAELFHNHFTGQLVICHGQFESGGIMSDGVAEEQYLDHRQADNEQHHPAKKIRQKFVKVDEHKLLNYGPTSAS